MTKKKELKIIFLNFYNGLIDRGAETFVKELASRLAKNNKIIVFQAGKMSGREKHRVVNIPFAKKKSYSNWEILLFTLKCLPRILKEKADIIYPINGRFQAFILRLITFFTKGKLVTAGHAGTGRDDFLNLLVWPDVFVCLTEKGKNWAKKWAPHVKTTIIPYGVDCQKFKPRGKLMKINLPKPIILTVAGKERFKRVEKTIKAVSQLTHGSLLLAGDQNQEIISLAKKLLGSKRFKQIKVKYEEMPQLYRMVDLFTLVSSKREAFGACYLEAMASNLAVVATDDQHRRDIVSKAGIFVNPENIKDYTLALQKALKKNWGDLPRKQAKKFSWEKVTEKYEKLFKNMVR